MTLICNEVLHQTFSYRFFFGEARQAFGATIPLLENGYPILQSDTNRPCWGTTLVHKPSQNLPSRNLTLRPLKSDLSTPIGFRIVFQSTTIFQGVSTRWNQLRGCTINPTPSKCVGCGHRKGWLTLEKRTSPEMIFYHNISYLKHSQTKHDHMTYPPQTFSLVRWLTHLTAGLQSPKKSEIGRNPAGFHGPVLDSSSLIHCNQRCIDFPSAKINKINVWVKEFDPPGKKHIPPKRHLGRWFSLAPGSICYIGPWTLDIYNFIAVWSSK